MFIETYIGKVRRRETRMYDLLYRLGKRFLQFSFPPVPIVGSVLFFIRWLIHVLKNNLLRVFYYPQLFAQQVPVFGKHLRLSDVPYIMNDGQITLGDHVSIGKHNSWFVGIQYQGAREKAKLIIGSNVSINFGSYISVANEVRIGNNVLIAEQVMIFDNNSHPIDPEERRQRQLLSAADVAPVIIEDDVWIGTSSIILKGVTVGEGAVVAAGSVVTKSVPPFTLVGGNPAQFLKRIR